MKQIINYNAIKSKLEKNGLEIDDIRLLKDCLKNINYNLIMGAFSSFFYINPEKKKYDPDASISQIIELYHFDCELAYKLLYYVLKIEKKLNTLIAYEIINQYKLEDHCLLKINKNILFNKIFPNIKLINPPISYDNFINLLTKYCSTNTSTKSYKNKKSTNVINMWKELPLDLMCLSWSFSTTFNVFIALDDEVINKIVRNFDVDITTNSGFIDFIKNILNIRNLITHNYVIFNSDVKYQSSGLNNLYETIFNKHIEEMDLTKLIKMIEYFTDDDSLGKWIKMKLSKLNIKKKFKQKITLK